MPDRPIFRAQHGEDAMLAQIFNTRKGVCVEVGGFDGLSLSNSLFFEEIGWRCVVVEPMPRFAEKIRVNRDCIVIEAAASSAAGEAEFVVAEGAEVLSTLKGNAAELERIELAGAVQQTIRVKTDTLDHMLQSNRIDTFDFISVDVEGAELDVLKGLSLEKYNPRVILVEENDLRPDSRVRRHLRSRGYRGFRRTGCNIWYARVDDPLVTKLARAKFFLSNVPFQSKSVAKAVLPDKIQSFLRRTRARAIASYERRI